MVSTVGGLPVKPTFVSVAHQAADATARNTAVHVHFAQHGLETANSARPRGQLLVIRPLSSDCAAYLPREWSNDGH